jgi:hypothetical protein
MDAETKNSFSLTQHKRNLEDERDAKLSSMKVTYADVCSRMLTYADVCCRI